MSIEVLYHRCAGIDVHQRFVVVCLSIIEAGKRRCAVPIMCATDNKVRYS